MGITQRITEKEIVQDRALKTREKWSCVKI